MTTQIRRIALIAILASLPSIACAALGGKLPASASTSTSAPGPARLAAMAKIPGVAQQAVTTNGVTVTQYANSDGTVFAVSWSGPVKPDLQALLGPYFPALNKPDPALSTLGMGVVHQTDLVIESYGRLRDFHGDAYIPSLTPPGFQF